MGNETEIRISVTGSPDAVRAIQGLRGAVLELQQAGGAAAAGVTATARVAGPAIVELGADAAQGARDLRTLGESGTAARAALDQVVPKTLAADVGRVSVKVDELLGNLNRVGGAMTVGITLPLVAVGGAAVKMAMDAVESENLFSVSMGKQADSARVWSEELRAQLGLNAYAVREQVGTFNVMFTSMRIGEQDALNMSEGLTQLAYDMASFYNLKTDDAFQKLQAGITGEAEPLKRLGILLDENTVKTFAYQHGIAETGSELTEQQKVLARFGTIMQQTTKAQGDLARTLDSPTNQLRLLGEQVAATSIDLGKELIPVVRDTIAIAIPLVRVVGDAVEEFGELPGFVKGSIGVLVGFGVAIGPVVYATTNLVTVLRSAGKAAIALRSTQIASRVGTLATELSAVGGIVAVGAPLALGLGFVVGRFFDVGRAADEAAKKAKESAANFHVSAVSMSKEMAQTQLTLARADYLDAGPRIEDLTKRKAAFEAAARQGGEVGLVSGYRQQARDMGAEIEALEAKMEAAASRMRDAKQRIVSLAVPFVSSTPAGTGNETGTGNGAGTGTGGNPPDTRTPLQILQSDTSTLLSNYEQLRVRGMGLVDVWREMVRLQGEAADLAAKQGGALTGEAGATRASALGLQTRLNTALDSILAPRVAFARDVRAPTSGSMVGVVDPAQIAAQYAASSAPVVVAGKNFDQAAQVAVASLGAMAQAAISGTQQMESTVVQGFASIAAAAVQQSNPVIATAIGVVGGILGSLFGRRSETRPTPVSVESYGSRALQQQKKEGPDVIRVLLVDSTTGEQTELLGYELGRAERRDAIVRVPRKR